MKKNSMNNSPVCIFFYIKINKDVKLQIESECVWQLNLFYFGKIEKKID